MLPIKDLLQIARGVLMGGADVVPGVSGGTVALILGIYERLVTAISRFDAMFVRHLMHREWSAAARHVDLRFLGTLGTGILLGVAGLAGLMHYLLDDPTATRAMLTYAAFFGLILASSLLVGRMVERWTAGVVALLIGGTVFGYWLVGLPLLQSPPEADWYVFLCGNVAICAMILPGISGSFILVLLGKYRDVLGALNELRHGNFADGALTTILLFAAGCAIGLLAFSRLLRWLLARHESQTMAVLCGFMAGSLRKIWPFKEDVTPTVTDPKLKELVNIWPESFGGEFWLTAGIATAAFAFVLLLDRLTKGHEHIPPLHDDAPPNGMPKSHTTSGATGGLPTRAER